MFSRDVTRYIVVGPARSGTTVTHLCLAGHPNVSALNDEVPVRPFFTEGISTFTHGNDLEEERNRGYLALFDAMCTLRRPGELKACGLKTAIPKHHDAVDFVKAVKAFLPELRIVLTVREDVVAQYGSLLLAKKTGQWHSCLRIGIAERSRVLRVFVS